MPISPERVHALLNPTSIALVGASDDSAWSIGFMRNLAAFQGSLHMVNPRRAEAFGRVSHATIADVPEPVDHAAVLVAAPRVLGVLEDCAAAGVKSATVIASGFQEAGPEGVAMAEAVRAFADANGIALIGPNCYGFNNYSGTFVSRYTIEVPPLPGAIGLSFQSGQLGAATADAALARGIRLRYVVSSGNELVVDTNDYFEYFVESPDIKVLGGVLERIPDPARFERIALRALEVGKPIVVLKPGKSAAASRIAIAHTGSITGSDAIADTYLRDLGVIRVDSPEELAETAGLLAVRGWPKGPRAAFFGFSGGAAELFAEEAEGTSITLEPHSPEVLAELSRVSTLPAEVIHNPFDMTVDGAVHYNEIVETLAASPDYDLLISQGQPPRASDEPWMAQFRDANAAGFLGPIDRHGKFGVFLETGDTQPGISVFEVERPEGAHWVLGMNGVKSISNAIDYGSRRERILRDVTSAAEAADDDRAVVSLRGKSGALTEVDSKDLLRAYGIPVTEDVLATSADEAAAAAERIGYPVVLKVVAPNVAHKSDAGGVVLNLDNADAVRAAYDGILTAVRSAVPDAQIEGIIVARQAVGGREFLAGITSDPQLGPVVVAGLGGIYVEVFKDAVLARPPLSRDRAIELIEGLKSAAILHGTRGEDPLDIDAFADVLVRLGQLASDHAGRVVELDINPLFVFKAGSGVLAADALVVVTQEEEEEVKE